MPYIDLEDVRSAAPQLRLSAQSRPSETEVRQIIGRVESELEGVLQSLGFTIPITGTNSIQIVKSMLVNEVVAQTLENQYVGVGDPRNFGSDIMHRRYADRVKQLLDPNDPFTLPDAPRGDLQEKLASETSSIAADIGIEDADFRMTRDMVF
jgi:hypothetical protein